MEFHFDSSLEASDIAAKYFALEPVKQHENTIARCYLLDQIDRSPHDKGNTAGVAKDWHITQMNLGQGLAFAEVSQDAEIQEAEVRSLFETADL